MGIPQLDSGPQGIGDFADVNVSHFTFFAFHNSPIPRLPESDP